MIYELARSNGSVLHDCRSCVDDDEYLTQKEGNKMALRFNVLDLNSMCKLPVGCKCKNVAKMDGLKSAVISNWIEYCAKTGMDIKIVVDDIEYKLEKVQYPSK